jgi:hypothetical protein
LHLITSHLNGSNLARHFEVLYKSVFKNHIITSSMTFTGTFIGTSGKMGYSTGKVYTVSTHPNSQGIMIINAPDDRHHQFGSMAELQKDWKLK